MTDGHVLKTDVKFSHDAGPQVRAATRELQVGGVVVGSSVQRQEREQRSGLMTFVQNRVISVNPEATTYNIDERRQKDNDDGEDAHQGAVQPGLDDPFGKCLQRDWEKLGTTSRKISIMNGFDGPFPGGKSARSSW